LLHPSGTCELFIIVSGQHAHVAATTMKKEKAKANAPVPSWMCNVRVQLLKDAPLATVRKVAGKLQGAAQSVRPLTMAQTMQLLLDADVRMRQERGGDSSAWRTELLREVYDDSGKTSITDGTQVTCSASGVGGGGGV
jgi:hypothetical protein